jgi:hypothetical protein
MPRSRRAFPLRPAVVSGVYSALTGCSEQKQKRYQRK